MRTYLYMCYQHLPEEFADHDSMYFIRNTPGMVPLPNTKEEALEILPNYFEMGILNGHSLVMLEHVIAQVRTSRLTTTLFVSMYTKTKELLLHVQKQKVKFGIIYITPYSCWKI